MLSISSFLGYVTLFLAICALIIVLVACFNLLTKSYKPQNTLIALIPIILFLILSSYFATTNFLNLLKTLEDQDYNTFLDYLG